MSNTYWVFADGDAKGPYALESIAELQSSYG